MTIQKNNKADDMDSTYLSREELEEFIMGLSPTDILRLKRIAKVYTGNHDLDADDLLDESILRTLSGDRKKCPRNLSIITFITGIMKSIASGEREKHQCMDQLEEDQWNAIEDLESSPENKVMESQAFKEIERLFEDDEEILLLIFHLQDGISPTEIQKAEGWTETQYNTIRRRMRRKWNNHTEQELGS